MAKISPVAGLVTRAAALLTRYLARGSISAEREASAACWRSRSKEVVTRRPPRSTSCCPYFSVSKSLT